jgi:hypothetical protein
VLGATLVSRGVIELIGGDTSKRTTGLTPLYITVGLSGPSPAEAKETLRAATVRIRKVKTIIYLDLLMIKPS